MNNNMKKSLKRMNRRR